MLLSFCLFLYLRKLSALNPRRASRRSLANLNFVYEPFNGDNDQIRLMKINRDTASNVFQYELARFSLQALPSYVALSYAWNETTLVVEVHVPEKTSIHLDGQTFQVGHHLAAALDYFCKHLPPGAWLWIDAICINQNDVDERDDQFMHMRSIYSKAESVVVWLGRGSHNSTQAVELIETVAAYDDSVHATDWIMNSLKDQEQRHAWLAIHHLFERSWWTRVWIRQEAALAQSVEVVVGNQKLSWDSLEKFIVDLSAIFHIFGPRFLYQRYIDHKALNALMTLQGLRNARLRGETAAYGLVPNLIITLHSKCSDERDRIYGIVGLSSDVAIAKADYRLSSRDIFIDLTRSYIQASGQLDIMLIDTQSRDSMNLPTWAPDWGSEVLVG
jgi:hypothetical protein